MTFTPTIYDWRASVEPMSQMFRAGGTSVAGGMTLGGASAESPEPGGRSELLLEFGPLAGSSANLDASWLVSRLIGGNVMRVRLWAPTVQLVADAALGGNTGLGVNWANNLRWANNLGWAFDPSAAVTVAGAKGATSFTADLVSYGRVLSIGHVVGFHLSGLDFAHVVTDISYSAANAATVTVSPPLRRAVTTSDRMLFRPTMLAVCSNAREVATNFKFGTQMALNAVRMVEALV